MQTTPRKPTRRLWLRIMLWSLVGVILAPLLWLGVRTFVAYDALMSAQARIGDARSNLLSIGSGSISALIGEIRHDTSVAASMMGDPVWMAAEAVPLVGPNLRVVREVTSTLDDFVHSGLDELLDHADELTLSVALPTGGSFDLEKIEALWPLVESTLDEVQATGARLENIDLGGTVGPVRGAVASATAQLTTILALADEGEQTLDQLLHLLGAEESQRYLLVVLDSLVDRPLGGAPVGAVVITLDEGAIVTGPPVALADVLSSADFARLDAASAFPSASEFNALAAELWLNTDSAPLTAVMTVDTVGLLQLIRATGPVEVGDVTHAAFDRASELLITDATPADPQRASVLATTAASTVTQFAKGDGATLRYLEAASKLRLQGHLSLWSAVPEVMELVTLTALDRSVPENNDIVYSYGGYLSQTSSGTSAADVEIAVQLAGPRCLPADRGRAVATWAISKAGKSADYSFVGFGPVDSSVTAVSLDGVPLEITSVGSIGARQVTATEVFELSAGPHSMSVEYRVDAAARGAQEYRTNARWTVTKLTLGAC